jgi:hypothetical protein
MPLNPPPHANPVAVLPPQGEQPIPSIAPKVLPPENPNPDLEKQSEEDRKKAIQAHADQVKLADKAAGQKE